MKLIIAGTRDKQLSIFAIDELVRSVITNTDDIKELVYGCAPGIDTCGKAWADSRYIEDTPFPADWANIDVPGAVPRRNKFGGMYNAKAGYDRNQKMADYCEPGDVLIAFRWNGSLGTSNMIKCAKNRKLDVYIFDFDSKGSYLVTTYKA